MEHQWFLTILVKEFQTILSANIVSAVCLFYDKRKRLWLHNIGSNERLWIVSCNLLNFIKEKSTFSYIT
jgi:hypothetical protein